MRRFSTIPAILKESTSSLPLLDHRVIGQRQSLFMLHPSSPGSVFWLPRGLFLMDAIKNLLRAEYVKFGFQEVQTPLIYSTRLWKQSGHLDNYRRDMFMVNGGLDSDSESESMTSEDDDFGLKPMNCPAHCAIFQNTTRSHRELPLRIADFSSLHRNELSGTLTGLTRLRQFHQDDGHIFCTNEQTFAEISLFMQMVKRVYVDVFGFKGYQVGLSTRPAKSIGTTAQWDTAESVLHQALCQHFEVATDSTTLPYTLNDGDGAFYGPKIDVSVSDQNGKSHQLATLQLDFQLPLRFGLEYMSPDESRKTPVLIHRAILGSLERFIAIWLESQQGKLPFWCSPRQCVVIPVSESSEGVMRYARDVREQLLWKYPGDPLSMRYMVDMDTSDATLSKKVRQAETHGYHYILVVGEQEVKSGVLSVRRSGSKKMSMSLTELRNEFKQREIELS